MSLISGWPADPRVPGEGARLVAAPLGKVAYDIYLSIRTFPGGIDAPAELCKPLLDPVLKDWRG